METMEKLESMEGVSPVETGKMERNREVLEKFRELLATKGRTQAYYETAAEKGLSYATVVKIVKRMEAAEAAELKELN